MIDEYRSSGLIGTPLFILGNPRSGTSLLRMMLNTHRAIVVPPESHFFLWLESRYSEWRMDRLDSYLDDLYASTKFETWKLDRKRLRDFIMDLSPVNYAELNALVYIHFGVESGKRMTVWGDKNKLWKEKLPAVRKYYPDARYIHIIRDGRDVACSFRELAQRDLRSKYAPNYPTDMPSLSKRWNVNITAINSFLSGLDADNYRVVRYEDLVSDPEGTLTEILEWLGLAWSDDLLDFYKVQGHGHDEPEEFYQWKEKLRIPVDESGVGRYLNELSHTDIDMFVRENKDILEEYGYRLME